MCASAASKVIGRVCAHPRARDGQWCGASDDQECKVSTGLLADEGGRLSHAACRLPPVTYSRHAVRWQRHIAISSALDAHSALTNDGGKEDVRIAALEACVGGQSAEMMNRTTTTRVDICSSMQAIMHFG